jgi:hypothetical protein
MESCAGPDAAPVDWDVCTIVVPVVNLKGAETVVNAKGGRGREVAKTRGQFWRLLQDAGGRPASTNSAFSCSSLLLSHLLSLTRGPHVWGRKHAQQQRVLHACVWMEARITSSAALGCKREGRRSPDARLLSTRSCEIGDQWHPYGG